MTGRVAMRTGAADPLARYKAKRNFARTPEPLGGAPSVGQRPVFVVQQHAARQLHYDFRLELDGVLASWAVPKGPSLDPSVKRMAVRVEDHPLDYASFEGVIPPKHYGAGQVTLWDRGTWHPLSDPRKGLRSGKLQFELQGHKLRGRWALVRMHADADGVAAESAAWLLMKERDAHARVGGDVLVEQPGSVLDGAAERSVAAPMPASLAPQLATLVEQPPPGTDWLYEIKLDGYRMLARIDNGQVRLFTRTGLDWTLRCPSLVRALQALSMESGWLDGEVVVCDAQGRPDFHALQQALGTRGDKARAAAHAGLRYVLFDLLFDGGNDLRSLPLTDRRDRLQTLLARSAVPVGDDGMALLRFSASLEADPHSLLASVRALGLEGLIGKRAGSAYRSQRSPDWIKLKTQLRQEFVIGGFTAPKGQRHGLGALVLGCHDEQGRLQPAGNVGTGFDTRSLRALSARLARIGQPHSPFEPTPAVARGATVHWVRPQLVAEVSFLGWTAAGHVRHAVFEGLRTDKPAREVVREQAEVAPLAGRLGRPAQAVAARQATARARAAVPVTHGQRVIDASSGVTKADLVGYFDRAAGLLLPQLRRRPVALLRAPKGVGGPTFFQKHAQPGELPGATLLDPSLDPDHAALLTLPNRGALVQAAQHNVLELHTWNMTAASIQRPDRIVFDLDPGDGVAWPVVQQAAHLVRGLLHDLGLQCLLKTSGGKGLHLLVPIAARTPWAVVKGFAQAVGRHLAQVLPQRFVARSGPRNRVGRIFVDHLRNGFGATTVSAWSPRCRPGLGVSVPVAWDELDGLTGGAHWTVATVGQRMVVGNAPWAGGPRAQALAPAMKAFGHRPTGA